MENEIIEDTNLEIEKTDDFLMPSPPEEVEEGNEFADILNEESNEEPTEEVKEEPTEEEPKKDEELPDDFYDKLKFKLLVNGQEIDATSKDVISYAQQFLAANIKLNQLNELKKQTKEQYNQVAHLMNTIKSGHQDSIIEACKAFGIDFDTLAITYVKEKLEESELTEEQRALKDARNRLKQYEMDFERNKKLQEEYKQKQMLQDYESSLEEAIPKILQIENVPVNKKTREYTLDTMYRLVSQGYQINERSVPVIAKMVKERLEEDAKYLLDDENMRLLIDSTYKKKEEPKQEPKTKKETKLVHKKDTTKETKSRYKFVNPNEWM